MAQSVKRLTLAQVMISRLMSLSPESGSVLAARSLEPASDSVSPSLSLHPSFTCALSLSFSQKIHIKKIKDKHTNKTLESHMNEHEFTRE